MIVLLIFLTIIGFIYLLRKRRKNEPFNPLPGPKGLPIIGNLHQFNPLKPHIYFAKLAKIYGPILTTRFGSTPAVVVQSAKTAKEVLHTQDLNFCYRPSTIATQRLSYKGLDITFAQSYGYFREIKKICVVHLFSSKRVESFTPIRQEVLRMVNKISTQISSFSGLEIVNLSELLMSFASSNICRIAFGKRYGENEGSNRSRFHNLLNDAQAMFTAFFFTDYFPSIGWLDKLTGQSSRLEKTFKDLDVFYDEIINDHLDPNRPVSETEDIIDVLLHLRKERAFTFDLTLDHIKGVLMNMFVAGTDTSAAMVVWAMTELIKNPTAMKKVQKELRGLAGNHKGYVSADDLPKLEYFKAVIKETLRFRPAAPVLIVRETLEKCTIEGYDILPKTLVFVNAWTIGRDPEYWKDPEVFMPERFMGSSIDYKGQDFEFIPFGAGRKMCPGMLLGVSNFELALANLLFSFDWELPDGIKMEDIDTDTLPGVTMHKKNPLCLVARKYT
ncbi:cytochrome P450 83B1-like isoform X1 [Chenopodium quinoa]|uniref:cytochrome P450 83B1-like isoform X1 n=1 Tax=Chenopodium quinoa TaxID=63459 RepID=UPI000B796631|nr:cytochrome P450 83B1-like isoform X1 [Chenopodium quinoa]